MSAPASEARLRDFLETISLEHLRTGAMGLAALYAFAAVALELFVPAPAGNVLGAVATGSAAMMILANRLLAKAPARIAHPAGAAVTALTLANGCLYLAYTHDPSQIASLAVVLLSCSCFFLSWPWITVTAALVAATFSSVVAWTLPDPHWTTSLPSLVLAVTLGAVIHETRLRAYRRLAELQFVEEDVRVELQHSVSAFQQSEERLRQLAELSSEAILIHELGRIVDANTGAAQLLGRAREDLVGITISSIFARDPSNAPKSANSLGQPFEAIVELPDGTKIPVEVSVTAVAFDGQMASVARLRDISDRKREQESLAARRALERLVTTIATELVKLRPRELDDGIQKAVEDLARRIGADHGQIALLGPDGQEGSILEWSGPGDSRCPAETSTPCASMPWLSRRLSTLEAVQIADVEALPPQASADRALLKLRGVRSLIVVPIAHGTSLIGRLSFEALRDTRPWSEETTVLLRLVAEIMAAALLRRRVLEELEASEARKAAILEAALDCIITADERGRILDFNPAAEKTFGHPRSEAVGRSVRELMVPQRLWSADDDGLRTLFAGAQTSILGRHVETTACRADGTEFPAEVAMVSVQSGSERVFTIYVRDITERHEIDRLRDELLATVSHELKTPLTSLRGFAELMLENDFPLPRQRKFISVIHNEAVRLTQLVNDFLDMKRIESGRVTMRCENVEMRKLIREVEELFRRDDGLHSIRLDLDPALMLVWGDGSQLRRILTNLTSNAIKFSPHGGTVTIGARNEATGVLLWVTDEGIGIAPEHMTALFEKFYRVDNAETRSIGGTGLGLALTKQMVNAHGGRIWVESDLGHGTTFYVTLPARQSPATGDSLGAGELSYAVPLP
jgi:PAS domain S-box-containing protein